MSERKVLNTIRLPQQLVDVQPLLGITLLIIGAYIKIPFYPVPFTLHTLAVFLIGLTQTPKQALFSTLGYLAMGSIGLPVFAGHVNLFWWMGKCAGYLFAFPLAAYLIAKFRGTIGNTFALLLGSTLILTSGFLGLIPFLGVSLAWAHGALAFIPCELGKIGMALALVNFQASVFERLKK